jgi:hypothetical protein
MAYFGFCQVKVLVFLLHSLVEERFVSVLSFYFL